MFSLTISLLTLKLVSTELLKQKQKTKAYFLFCFVFCLFFNLLSEK